MGTLSVEERARIEQDIRSKARRRVRAVVGFYWHVAVFALTNAGLIAINLTQTPSYHWFVWPLSAWGAALLLHGFAIFQTAGLSESMIEAEIQREMTRRGLT
jgi:hypothetical protein